MQHTALTPENTVVVDPFRSVSPRWFAIAAFVFFAPVVILIITRHPVWWADYPGILFHLAMFMLVAKLPAPDWAKAAGYGWLVLDVMTAVLTLNHVPYSIFEFVRFGGHIFGGIWLATASLSGPRGVKIVGVITGVYLFAYTFVSPFVTPVALGPNSLLVLIWLVLVALHYSNDRVAHA